MKRNLSNTNILKIVISILLLLSTVSLTQAVVNYGSNTYGTGAYGKAVCGDNVCDSTESCSICSSDCGSCPSTGNGGGGDSGTFIPKPKNPSSTHVWLSLSKGSTASMSINNEEISFTKLEVTVKNDLNNVELRVEKLLEVPQEIDMAEKLVYQYLEIINKNIEIEDISKIVIRFRVSEDWLNENSLKKNDIILRNYKNNEWEDLSTIIITGNDLLYEAESNSFGYFAVASKRKPGLVEIDAEITCVESWECVDWSNCIEEKETRECKDTNNCNTTTQKPSDSRDCIIEVPAPVKKQFTIGFWFLVSLGLIGLLTTSYYARSYYSKHVVARKKEPKQIQMPSKQIQMPHIEPQDVYTIQLNNYIRNSINKGLDKVTIKRILLATGWSFDAIERNLKNYSEQANAPLIKSEITQERSEPVSIITEDPLKKATIFIMENLIKGHDKGSIKNGFLSAGWSENTVEKLMQDTGEK